MAPQYVDKMVSLEKFENELQTLLAMNEINRRRGIWILESKFPFIIIGFHAAKLNPPPLVHTVKFDFTNYDIEPLSISFINPISFEPIKSHLEIFPLQQSIINKSTGLTENINLIQQDFHTGSKPFICLPGTREYHNHPAHTGDFWLLHRGIGGEGTLGYFVDKIYEHGISQIKNYLFTVTQNYISPGIGLEYKL